MKYQEILKTEEAITLVKETFSRELMKQLNLVKVSAPIAVLDGTGINDDLNGVERPVSFPVKALEEKRAVIVHSLAKWKRLRLKELEVISGKGIITDMRALRPDEEYSPIHSIYVDQWDWEKHIKPKERTLIYLKKSVKQIYEALKETEKVIYQKYKMSTPVLPDDITFIHSERLLQKYPFLTPKQRENEITKEYGAVFIIGIGAKLSNGEPHDGRAADYDDWSSKGKNGLFGLNGDILVWNPILQSSFEISSMGIRVDAESLLKQLTEKDCLERSKLTFHNMLLANELPQSIGGGIGQSRLCMFLLKKSHIGEVQVGIWSEDEKKKMELEGVKLL